MCCVQIWGKKHTQINKMSITHRTLPLFFSTEMIITTTNSPFKIHQQIIDFGWLDYRFMNRADPGRFRILDFVVGLFALLRFECKGCGFEILLLNCDTG
ncbi:hypothetical protein AKJ16_DCAP24853 [Drosera capensis]